MDAVEDVSASLARKVKNSLNSEQVIAILLNKTVQPRIEKCWLHWVLISTEK
jgi:hypothetical protein